METTKKSKKKPELVITAETIINGYREHILTHGKRPESVFSFVKLVEIKEEGFYSFFGSFEALDRHLWKNYLVTVKEKLTSDEAYYSFSVREKILAFYFTLVEVLKTDRSLVVFFLKEWKNPTILPNFLKGFKSAFDDWIQPIINEGKQAGEVATRPFIDKQYDNAFWLHLIFIIQFWKRDGSANFEKTDVAIEKSVNLAFDLIGKGVLDNAIDFGKFLYQNK